MIIPIRVGSKSPCRNAYLPGANHIVVGQCRFNFISTTSQRWRQARRTTNQRHPHKAIPRHHDALTSSFLVRAEFTCNARMDLCMLAACFRRALITCVNGLAWQATAG